MSILLSRLSVRPDSHFTHYNILTIISIKYFLSALFVNNEYIWNYVHVEEAESDLGNQKPKRSSLAFL